MIITTARLLLRELDDGDVDALAALYADPEVMRWIGRGGPLTREHAQRTVAAQQENYRGRGYGEWATVRRDDNALIGMCGLIHWPDIGGREEVEVAYMLAQDAWGHGYATEAAVAIRDWAREHLHRDRLVSVIYPDNTASQRVAAKLGMAWERDVDFAGTTVGLWSIEW